MIIVLEGCDGAGKTTMAALLNKTLQTPVVRGSSFELAQDIGKLYSHSMRLLDSDRIIIDRFLLSNLVYAPLYSYPLLKDWQIDNILSKMGSRNVLTMYLDTGRDTIIERLTARGDEKIETGSVDTILNRYEQELQKFTLPLVRVQ